MGFISDLARDFVKSAVNQVGRDGGKVISNKIYKGTLLLLFHKLIYLIVIIIL